MPKIDQSALVGACRRLVKLVDEPQPGLAVWNIQCLETVEELGRLLHPSEAAPEPAPVTGDRLLAALACHIDHDAPPGMAAREIARVVLELLGGSANDLPPLALHEGLVELKRKFGR